MYLLDYTFDTPEENLACDEALLDLLDEGLGPEILRFWEPRSYFVVAGYSNKISTETRLQECENARFPIYRRTSGGGTVLQGMGCLNYSLLLKIDGKKEFENITSATCFIMKRHAEAIAPEVKVQGISDLTLNGLKFSGNAQRRKRSAFLFHGTFLLNFDLSKIESVLSMPSRRPEYRKDRPHSQFLTNLDISAENIKKTLVKTWAASKPFDTAGIPLEQIRKLVLEKYSQRDWNYKF